MSSTRNNALDQALDVAGSLVQNENMILANEPNQLGSIIPGQNGVSAIIYSINTNNITIIGLTGMTIQDKGNFLSLSGDDINPSNNGVFLIDSYISANSITIINPNAIINNINLTWQEYMPYSLEDDLNYIRTDRSNIKGTSYYSSIPTYQQPDNLDINIPTNLTNITGKTTDAISYNIDRAFYNIAIQANDTFITMNSINNLKHADPINTTGIPCFDVLPFMGDFESCYVHITDGYANGNQFVVLDGYHVGEVIFGITYAGSSISPNSVEVHFYSAPSNLNYMIYATPYTWEAGQDGYANFLYAYNERLDRLDKNAFRTIPALGILVDAQSNYITKQIEIDFGNILTAYKTFVIIDPDVNSSSLIFPTQSGVAPDGRSFDENEMDPIIFAAMPSNGQFLLIASSLNGPVVGNYVVNYGIK